MGSITEKQKEFIVPNWSYPRPGVTQTPQGMELEGDWYDIRVMDDQSVSVFRINDNKTICKDVNYGTRGFTDALENLRYLPA